MTGKRAAKPAPNAAAKPVGESGRLLLLGLIAAAAVAWVGFDRAGGRLEDVQGKAPTGNLEVRLSEADQKRIGSWPEFFACHGLRYSDLVIAGTLRANDFGTDRTWRPDRRIKLALAPSSAMPRFTPEEVTVMNQVSALGSDPAALARACSATAPPADAKTPAAETGETAETPS